MSIVSLDELGLRHGTDKSSAHHDYLRHYDYFISTKTKPVRTLLEIGVFDGASLRTWRDYLPDAKIVGLDVDERCKAFEGPGVRVELCDQSDNGQLVDIGVRYGPFDLIIDDGSHIWSHQILTFETLFPFLNPNGIFIIEDIDTSFGHYVPVYSRDSTISAAHYVSKLANYLLAHTAADLSDEPDLRIRKVIPLIDRINFLRRSVLIQRK